MAEDQLVKELAESNSKLSEIANSMSKLADNFKSGGLAQVEAQKEESKAQSKRDAEQKKTNDLLSQLVDLAKTVRADNPFGILGLLAGLILGAAAFLMGFVSGYLSEIKKILKAFFDIERPKFIDDLKNWFDKTLGSKLKDFKAKLVDSDLLKNINKFADDIKSDFGKIKDGLSKIFDSTKSIANTLRELFNKIDFEKFKLDFSDISNKLESKYGLIEKMKDFYDKIVLKLTDIFNKLESKYVLIEKMKDFYDKIVLKLTDISSKYLDPIKLKIDELSLKFENFKLKLDEIGLNWTNINAGIEKIRTTIVNVYNLITNNQFIGLLQGLASGLFSTLGAVIVTGWNIIKDLIPIISNIITTISSVITGIVTFITSNVFNFLTGAITRLVGLVSPFFESIGTIFSAIGSMFSTFKTVIMTSIETFMAPFRGVLSFFFDIGSRLGRLFGFFGFFITAYEAINVFIDGYAKGGFLQGIKDTIAFLIADTFGAPIDLLKDFLSWILKKFGFDELSKKLDDIGSVTDKITEFVQNVFTWIESFVADPKQALSNLWSEIMKANGDAGFVGLFFLPIRKIIEWVENAVKFFLPDEWSNWSISDLITDFLKQISQWLEAIFGAPFGMINALRDKVGDYLPDWLENSIFGEMPDAGAMIDQGVASVKNAAAEGVELAQTAGANIVSTVNQTNSLFKDNPEPYKGGKSQQDSGWSSIFSW